MAAPEIAATLVDSRGPLRARLLAPLLASLLPLGAIPLFLLGATQLAAVVLLLGLATLCASRYVQRRRVRRDVRVRIEDGSLFLSGAGLFGGRIRAIDVEGANAARSGREYLLALQVAGRPEPIALELPDASALRRVRSALGIGPSGRGALRYTAVAGTQYMEFGARAFVGLFLVVFAGMVGLGRDGIDSPVLSIAAVLTALAFVLGALSRYGRKHTLTLDASGIHSNMPNVQPHVEYGVIDDVTITPLGFDVSVPGSNDIHFPANADPLVGEGMTSAERDVVRALLLDSVERANGRGARVGDSDAAMQLARRPGESAAAWLARIDALAATRNSGYRGASLSDDELIGTLEDIDLTLEVRAAAARILARGQEAVRVRVAPVVAAEHDAKVRVRIAAAAEGRDAELVAALDEDWTTPPASSTATRR